MTPRLLFLLLIASIDCTAEIDGGAGAGRAQRNLDGSSGNTYVNYHRDRLLDGYAQYKGLANRVDAWNSLNAKQRWLFLIQTDLLGNRTFMTPWVYPVYVNNPNDGCYYGDGTCGQHEIIGGQDAYGPGCVLYAPDGDGGWGCNWLDTRTCVAQGLCWVSPAPVRYDWSMALEHVTRMYEILGSPGCGGDDTNRIFWQADDTLINAFRNRTTQMWGANGDLGGPHAPFNNASSTYNGRPFSCDGPDGQAQFFSYDWQGQAFWRGSAYLPADGRLFELDDDYNTTHDSSPDCFYCGGQWAVTMYQNHWCPSQGNFAPCDWSYAPAPVAPSSVCGNGSCEAGENGANCPADCCDFGTPCFSTYLGQGVYYCRSMDGGPYGWITAGDASAYCSDGSQVCASFAACGSGTVYYCEYLCSGGVTWAQTSACDYSCH